MKKKFFPELEDDRRLFYLGYGVENPLDKLPIECKEFLKKFQILLDINSNDMQNIKISEQEIGNVRVPETISNEIMQYVFKNSPVFSRATQYSAPQVNVWYDDINNGEADLVTQVIKDFVEPEKMDVVKTIQLGSLSITAPVYIGKSTISDAYYDIYKPLIDCMATQITNFIDNSILNGYENDHYTIDGLSKLKNSVTAKAQNKITPYELKILRNRLHSKFQENAIWVMHPDTWAAIDILADGVGRCLASSDYSLQSSTPHFLLGKPVFLSEFMPKAEAGKTAIYYGDFKAGLAVNIAKKLEIQYKNLVSQHGIGFYGYMAWDAKVVNEQAIIKLTMKA